MKNKYSIIPLLVAVQGERVPTVLATWYLMDTLPLNKLMNALLDTSAAGELAPYSSRKASPFELHVAVRG